ncbi:phage tail tape measure protein [Amycolatopsis sp. NPDC049159]|uniref:phage tail tape measure protein n=1 Tax=Amycolatopsis sp. NPDC049159 TaxID=3157210 RepID=UPI0033C74891
MPGGRIEIDVEPNLKGFDGKVASKLRGLQGPLGSTAKGIGLAVAGGIGLAAVGFKQVIDIGIEYQSSLNDLQAVSHATGDQMARVGATAKALGSDMSLPATSAADAAAAMTELAKGGLSVDQAMTAAKGTLQLAAAAQIDAAQAAEIQSQALNAFGLSADNAGHVSDVLANAANAASGEITDFAQAMGQVGAVAHQFGLSIDETTTALGLFANAGIKGSDAGTLIKSALLALANPSKPAAKAIEQLGLKTYDATGKFVGLKSIFEQLHDASGRMTDAQYQQATATVFGSDAVRLAGVAAGTTGEQWDAMATAIGHAGGASEVAAAKTKGLGGAIEGFKSQVETVEIDAFEKIGPALEAGVRGAADAVSKYGPQVVDGLEHVIDFAGQVGPGIAKKVAAGATEVAQAGQRLIAPFEQGAKQALDRGIGIVTTAVGGFIDVGRKAVDVAQPIAKGIADIAKGATTASGPLGAVRLALELTYDAASGVLTILRPFAAGIGEVLHLFGELPGPVQAAAFALLALKVGPGILNGLKGALSGVRGEAEGASTKLGLVGKTVGVIAAPARATIGAVGGAVGVLRQFNDEARVQREIGAAAGQSIGRMGSAAAAFNTSAIPAVAAARGFVEQTRAIKEGAAGAGQPINTLSAAVGTLVERSSALSQARDRFTEVSSSTERFGKIAGAAAAGGSLLKSAAGGLVGAFGGPWGIAIAAAGVGLSMLAQRNEEAAQKAAAHKQAVDDLLGAYRKSGGVIDQSIISTNNKALADLNVAANAKAAGSSFALYSAAANGNATALGEVTKSSDAALASIGKESGLRSDQIKGLQDVNHELLKNGGAYEDVADKVADLSKKTNGYAKDGATYTHAFTADQDNLVNAILNGTGALGKQIAQNREAQQLYELLAQAESNLSAETIKMYEAQNKAADSARAAATAGLAYKDALAQLKTAQEQTSQALKDNGENSEQYQAALRGEEHAILAVLDAKKAEAIANSKASSDILKLHDGTVAQNAEAVKLAATYKGAIPDALRTAIANIGVADSAAAGLTISVNEAGQAVYALPDGRTIVISGDVKQAKEAIDSVEPYAAGKKGTVPISANADEATGKINQTLQYADGSTGIVTIDGKKDPADGKVYAVVTLANGTTTYMRIDAINQGAKDKTIEVVRYADGSVGYIQVRANTAAAEAAINQVSRDRTGTITMIVRTDGSVRVGGGNNIMNATGNVLEPYAAGGIKPMRAGIAQIVPPRTLRVIGDRMVDDEAYIPINQKSRSISLLTETARRMGFDLMRRYATGGIAQQGSVSVSSAGLIGPLQITGSLDIGGVLVPLVDARISAADHADGDALYRGRRN